MHTHILLHSPFGDIRVAERDGAICRLWLPHDPAPASMPPEADTPLLRRTADMLHAYWHGETVAFDLPLAPLGTPFMQAVWQALRAVPYGRTAAYKDIAQALGKPGASRAVGLANNRNPIPLFIPCHRIIGAHGGLTGYRGGLGMKKALLDLEAGRQSL